MGRRELGPGGTQRMSARHLLWPSAPVCSLCGGDLSEAGAPPPDFLICAWDPELLSQNCGHHLGTEVPRHHPAPLRLQDLPVHLRPHWPLGVRPGSRTGAAQTRGPWPRSPVSARPGMGWPLGQQLRRLTGASGQEIRGTSPCFPNREPGRDPLLDADPPLRALRTPERSPSRSGWRSLGWGHLSRP